MSAESVTYTALALGSPLPTSAGGNVRALVLDQDTAYPAIRFQRITSAPVVSLGGDSNLTRVRMQIDSFALTYSEARQLAVEVRSAMADAGAIPAGDQDSYEDDVKVYRVQADYYLWE